MSDTMKALIFEDVGKVRLDTLPIPEVNDDGIVIRVAYAGICGSDIHGYTKGGRYGGLAEGRQFGHEFVGTIVEVGKNVKDLKIGDRVWIDPSYSSEGGARYSCMAGGFAEYAVSVKAIKDETVFVLPDGLSFKAASLIEPFGVGVHTKNRTGVQAGDNVLMWGAGPIGLMGWAAMKHQGVKNIIVAEQMPQRIEFARELGADVFDNSDADVMEYAGEVLGMVDINGYSYVRPNIDKYIDYVGLGALLGEYLEKGRPCSTFGTLGLDARPLTINPAEFMSKQFTVTGARQYTPDDIREVIDTLMDKSIDIAKIISGVFRLEDATEAFETACDKNSGFKYIFEIGGEE